MPPPAVVNAAGAVLGPGLALSPVGEGSAKSGTWMVRSPRGAQFLKRVPRACPEPDVLEALAALVPGVAPAPIATDLVPAPAERWFLMTDAGRCDRAPLSASATESAARLLGELQRAVQGNAVLAGLVPCCAPGVLVDVALDCCHWSRAGQWDPDSAGFLRLAERSLVAAAGAPTAGRLAEALASLPATMVHGDVWAGNIARAGASLALVDWGDALWGVGAVDVVNLLVCRPAPLDSPVEEQVWAAFAQGLGVGPIGEDARNAAHIAHDIASLLIDRSIAVAVGRPPQWLRGTVPTLKALLGKLTAWS